MAEPRLVLWFCGSGNKRISSLLLDLAVGLLHPNPNGRWKRRKSLFGGTNLRYGPLLRGQESGSETSTVKRSSSVETKGSDQGPLPDSEKETLTVRKSSSVEMRENPSGFHLPSVSRTVKKSSFVGMNAREMFDRRPQGRSTPRGRRSSSGATSGSARRFAHRRHEG
jgi:hypothetical protein